jgi:hypothetical protein
MNDFQAVFNRLKPILGKFESELTLIQNGPDGYGLNTQVKYRDANFYYFGGVQTKKNYVSYHLMGVYIFPELLEDISPALKKRMQGKSCFNFTKVDEALFTELAALTETSFERMKRAGMITTSSSLS